MIFPDESISEFRIRVEEILLPSEANFIGTITISTSGRFRSFLFAFKISPFLPVSSLTTHSSTFPSITAGPKSFSNFAISYLESGNFSSISDFRNVCRFS